MASPLRRSRWPLFVPFAPALAIAPALAVAVAVALALALAHLTPAALAAQARGPAAGAEPALRDSLRRVESAPALLELLEAARRDRSASRTVRETRIGWILLRLGELATGRERLDEAIRAFDEAIYRDKTNAEAWVGLAETKLLLEQRKAVPKATMHHRDGVYYEDAALEHLVTALRLRPSYPAAVSLLARLLIDFDAPVFPDALVESIRLAAAHPENGPVPQLLLGRYLRKRLALDSAAAAFRRFAELGGDPGLADLELARILHRQGHVDDAAQLYLAGAMRADTLARAALRRDLTWFATPQELAAYDSLPAAVGPWLQALWAERDAAELHAPGDRLKEHLRRWWHVQEKFELVGRRKKVRFGWGVSVPPPGEFGTLFAPGALPEHDPRALGVDDRGVIYMRHGEPDGRAMAVSARGRSGCHIANESWKYELATGPLILHFCASEALGMTAPTTLVTFLPDDAAILGARSNLDTRYAALELAVIQLELAIEQARKGHVPVQHVRDLRKRLDEQTIEFAKRGAASIRHGLATDTHPREYERLLEPIVQIYAVGHDAATGRALVVFALRGDRIEPVERDGRLVYPVKIRVTAVDTAAGITRTVDTLRLFATRDTLDRENYLYGTLDLALPPGSYYTRVLLEQAERAAAGAAGREVTLPVAGRFAMSDLITGSAASGLVWRHRGRAIPLNPLDAYVSGGSVELYYELTGTTPAAEYRTSVDLARIGGDGEGRGKSRLSLRFDDRADGPELVVQRALRLEDLRPGRYLLTVEVEDRATGRRIARERVINVVRGH